MHMCLMCVWLLVSEEAVYASVRLVCIGKLLVSKYTLDCYQCGPSDSESNLFSSSSCWCDQQGRRWSSFVSPSPQFSLIDIHLILMVNSEKKKTCHQVWTELKLLSWAPTPLVGGFVGGWESTKKCKSLYLMPPPPFPSHYTVMLKISSDNQATPL